MKQIQRIKKLYECFNRFYILFKNKDELALILSYTIYTNSKNINQALTSFNELSDLVNSNLVHLKELEKLKNYYLEKDYLLRKLYY